MGKLEKIKAELAKLLIKYSVVKTDNGVLNYEGEDLVAGMDVYIENEEGEKIAAADGEYTTEDNKVITVKDGKVESIVDPVAEVDAEEEIAEETPAEEVTEETPAEDEKPVEEEKPAEEVTEEEELEDEDKRNEVSSDETEEDAIAKIREEIDELYKLVDSILEKIGETRKEADERLSKIEKMSAAKPAAEEFEQLTAPKKTGDAKLDKFLANFGK